LKRSSSLKWYDYLAALLVADVMLGVLFLPYIGFVAAYALYEVWIEIYCKKIRLNQENTKWR